MRSLTSILWRVFLKKNTRALIKAHQHVHTIPPPPPFCPPPPHPTHTPTPFCPPSHPHPISPSSCRPLPWHLNFISMCCRFSLLQHKGISTDCQPQNFEMSLPSSLYSAHTYTQISGGKKSLSGVSSWARIHVGMIGCPPPILPSKNTVPGAVFSSRHFHTRHLREWMLQTALYTSDIEIS